LSVIDEAELAGWLRLVGTPGLGHTGQRRLLAAFGSPGAALAAGQAGWREVIGPKAARSLADAAARAPDLLENTLRWLTDAPRRHVLTLGDPAYPAALLNTADPPVLLFAEGDLALLSGRCLAVVGSRHASAQGLDNARAFAAHLSQAGLTIVSGLALGIDAAAHEGGLQGRGSTVAVVGTGLDLCYPRRHAALAQRIVAQGVVLSELPLGTPPLPEHFPRRNRIIAGLSAGTLVVEAAMASGSLITARQALESGREVFAIPGSIHAPQSRGCHHLIKQGAKLVETAEDILQELAPAVQAPLNTTADSLASPDAEQPESALLDALGFDPVTLDALIARTGWPADRLQIQLLELELDQRVQRLPGGLYQRRGTA
jgi:DNA processing protein